MEEHADGKNELRGGWEGSIVVKFSCSVSTAQVVSSGSIMIRKKWILGPQRAGLNNKWEAGPEDSTLSKLLGLLGRGARGLQNLTLAQSC